MYMTRSIMAAHAERARSGGRGMRDLGGTTAASVVSVRPSSMQQGRARAKGDTRRDADKVRN